MPQTTARETQIVSSSSTRTAVALVFGLKSPQKENSANSSRKLRLSTFALAKTTGEPLLFKGEDFIHTDILAVRA